GQRSEPPAVIAARNGLPESCDCRRVVVVGKPIKVALNAENEAVDLVVDTYLAAADEGGVIVVAAPIHAQQRVRHGAVAPPGAQVAAEIEPGPAKYGRDVCRRLVGRRRRSPEIGRL